MPVMWILDVTVEVSLCATEAIKKYKFSIAYVLNYLQSFGSYYIPVHAQFFKKNEKLSLEVATECSACARGGDGTSKHG